MKEIHLKYSLGGVGLWCAGHLYNLLILQTSILLKLSSLPINEQPSLGTMVGMFGLMANE